MATQTCTNGEWSAPRFIAAEGSPPAAMAYWPELATTRGAAYIAGMDLRQFITGPLPETPLTVWEIGGRSLGRPAGKFRFAYPHLLVDARDRLHLVWGEPAGGAVAVAVLDWVLHEKTTSLWTASYDRDAGWSTPRKVFEAPELELQWNNNIIPSDGESTRGRWLLAVPSEARSYDGGHVVLVGFDGDSVVTTTIRRAADDAHGGAIYSSVTSLGDHIYVGFISAGLPERAPSRPHEREAQGPKHMERDINSVFLQQSLDGGGTWRPSVVVSRSGEHAAYEVKTVATPDGRLHLVWLQERPSGDMVLRHVMSADGGATWSASGDYKPSRPGEPRNLRVVADACGMLHVVYEQTDLATGRSRLAYVTWDGRWSGTRHLFPSVEATKPALRRGVDGRLLLAFVARPIDSSEEAPYTPMFAELPVR